MVIKWQSVLDELKEDGTFEKIYRSYIMCDVARNLNIKVVE